MDLIIKNNTFIVAEIKSSISKAEVYILERKAHFYEQLHNCRISRIMVISLFVDNQALAIAKNWALKSMIPKRMFLGKLYKPYLYFD